MDGEDQIPIEFSASPLCSRPISVTFNQGDKAESPCVWYTVVVGRAPGIYLGVNGIQENIIYVPGSSVARHSSLEEAKASFTVALRAGAVRKATVTILEQTLALSDWSTCMGFSGVLENPAGNKFYAVYVGREPGVTCDAVGVKGNMEHIRGSRCQKFPTQVEAMVSFLSALQSGQVKRSVYDIVFTSQGLADFATLGLDGENANI
ncbi:hypothetical protein CPC08DRAFT_768017 [Agrocybe pediades]|nr:hypothetical protein CPC08DRAFT_768017 [Agrocybe pediades]